MCLGGFTSSIDKLRGWGVGLFFKPNDLSNLLENVFFLPKRRFVKFRAHGNLVALETKCWMAKEFGDEMRRGYTEGNSTATSS